MTQLGEGIAAIAFSDEEFECPFNHKKKSFEEQKNVMPKDWGKNDPEELAKNMQDQAFYEIPIDITWDDKTHKARYSAHHLIPGNACWPNTKLQKWIEKGVEKHIQYNYGYNVNKNYNGVSLPSWHGYPAVTKEGWKALQETDLDKAKAYAFKCMEGSSDTGTRQFHDTHPAYNEFVINVLDKIAARLEIQNRRKGRPGCGKKRCSGDTTNEKPFDPPVKLLQRLEKVTDRLRDKLMGDPKNWRMPIYTSRFALMYKENIEEKIAREKLSKAQSEQRNFIVD